MEDYITKSYLNNGKVDDTVRNEYETYNLTMNTLRLFPNFVSAFIKAVSTNRNNPYNANFNKTQEVNPNLQRGCEKYMKISLSDAQKKQCPK